MGFAGFGGIGSALSLAQGLGNKGGGSGGTTPQEAALAAYQVAQGQLRNMTTMAHHGLGASTMATVGNIGPQVGGALTLAGLSDQNQAQQFAGQQQALNAANFNQGFNTQQQSQGTSDTSTPVTTG